jgi:glycosyltransferase involved in cell wall biosynthesis
MKLLIYADTPTCNTGFGIVNRNIIKQLLKQIPDIEIDVLGINERGDHHELRHEPRVRIYPAWDGQEVHGRFKLIQFLAKDKSKAYDHVLFIHDILTLVQPIDANGDSVASAVEKIKPFTDTKYYFYFPIDVPFIGNKSWLDKIKAFDTLIPYTQFAKSQLLGASITTDEPMYHGVDTNIFKPLARPEKKRLKKELFEIDNKRTLISIIARNQWRKDIPMSIEIFKEYKKLDPDAFLYIHSKLQDVGGDIKRYLNLWDLQEGKDYATAGSIDPQNGVSEDLLNKVYNATDLLLSSARGEGFGLPYLEALATKTPIMTAGVSVEYELLPPMYYHFETAPLYISSGQDALPYPRRTTINSDRVAKKIFDLLNREDLQQIVDKAYSEVKVKFNWEIEVGKLVAILSKPLPRSKKDKK